MADPKKGSILYTEDDIRKAALEEGSTSAEAHLFLRKVYSKMRDRVDLEEQEKYAPTPGVNTFVSGREPKMRDLYSDAQIIEAVTRSGMSCFSRTQFYSELDKQLPIQLRDIPDGQSLFPPLEEEKRTDPDGTLYWRLDQVERALNDMMVRPPDIPDILTALQTYERPLRIDDGKMVENTLEDGDIRNACLEFNVDVALFNNVLHHAQRAKVRRDQLERTTVSEIRFPDIGKLIRFASADKPVWMRLMDMKMYQNSNGTKKAFLVLDSKAHIVDDVPIEIDHHSKEVTND